MLILFKEGILYAPRNWWHIQGLNHQKAWSSFSQKLCHTKQRGNTIKELTYYSYRQIGVKCLRHISQFSNAESFDNLTSHVAATLLRNIASLLFRIDCRTFLIFISFISFSCKSCWLHYQMLFLLWDRAETLLDDLSKFWSFGLKCLKTSCCSVHFCIYSRSISAWLCISGPPHLCQS